MKTKSIRSRSVFHSTAAVAAILMTAVLSLMSFTPCAIASPGLLQLATRDGFWSNRFPDKLISLTHVYSYWADEYADSDGNNHDVDQLTVGLGIERLIKPWHFGSRNQYQYILEGILAAENISVKGDGSASGLFDPMVYTSIGWNNPSATTNLQLAAIAVSPWGSSDLHDFTTGSNSYKVMPLVAIEQLFGNFWIDASTGYYHYFDDLSERDTHGSDYWELNVIPSYHIGSVSLYVQGDYIDTQDSKLQGVSQHDSGYNYAVAPGIGWFFKPNMEVNLKYVIDVAGENQYQGQGFNFRFLWIF